MKAKQFWLTGVDDGYNGIYDAKPDFDYEDVVHVIEYSAYSSLSNELDSTTECLIAEQNMHEQDQLDLRLALEVIKQIEQLAARPHKKAIDDIRQLCYGILVKYEIADPEQV